MHGHLWSGRAFSGGPSFGTDEEKGSMLLVMRVLSLVPLGFKVRFVPVPALHLFFGANARTDSLANAHSQPVAWTAPLSRELLVFNSFVRSLTRALRILLEVRSLLPPSYPPHPANTRAPHRASP